MVKFHRNDESRFEELPNIPLESPVFLGKISERMPDPILDDCVVRVSLDRWIPPKYAWCKCQLRRNGRLVTSTEICSTHGTGARGPAFWGLDGLADKDVEINDELWAIEQVQFRPYVLVDSFIGFGDIGVWAHDTERDAFLDWFAANRCVPGDVRWSYCKADSQRQDGRCIDLGSMLIPPGEILEISSVEHDLATAQGSPDFARLLGIIESITRGDWKIRVDMNGSTSWRRGPNKASP